MKSTLYQFIPQTLHSATHYLYKNTHFSCCLLSLVNSASLGRCSVVTVNVRKPSRMSPHPNPSMQTAGFTIARQDNCQQSGSRAVFSWEAGNKASAPQMPGNYTSAPLATCRRPCANERSVVWNPKSSGRYLHGLLTPSRGTASHPHAVLSVCFLRAV